MYKFKLKTIPAIELSSEVDLFFLNVEIVKDDSSKPLKLFRVVIECVEELNWFIEKESFIKNDKLPYCLNESLSIAAAIKQFYENANTDDETQLEAMFNYRKNHGIRFAFRGQDIIDAYIGLTAGFLEISCAENSNSWVYKIDFDSLIDQIKTIRELGLDQTK